MRLAGLPRSTALALALALAALTAVAQTALPPFPAPSAPASSPQGPGPRVQTPTELREASSTPGDLRPEEKVTPQIVIPLRKAPPPTKAERNAVRRGTPAATTTIDDSAARCEAEASKATREKCLANLASKKPSPPTR